MGRDALTKERRKKRTVALGNVGKATHAGDLRGGTLCQNVRHIKSHFHAALAHALGAIIAKLRQRHLAAAANFAEYIAAETRKRVRNYTSSIEKLGVDNRKKKKIGG
jgi:hypothetical protein